MNIPISRRLFLQSSACGACMGLAGNLFFTPAAAAGAPAMISPGAIRSKVRVGLLYLGQPQAHWPTPALDLNAEMQGYAQEFKQRAGFRDVEFVGGKLVSKPEEVQALAGELATVEGLLLIHLSMGVREIMKAALALGKPAVLFAKPYSGHEWSGFGQLMQQPEGALLDCILSSDCAQLEVAVRPFRAIHHLREARILNVTARELHAEFCAKAKERLGTEIIKVGRDEVLEAYEAIAVAAAEQEADALMARAEKIVEPARDEVVRSCRLALAFEDLLGQHEATTIAVECYGSMYRQLPAFPCIGFTRLNDMGLAGICESDLNSALTFILLQGLSGRPGFISDPTIDEAEGSIILAHCLGSTKMEGPEGAAAPFRLRTIMERQEGAVMQVFMPVGPKVTQAILVGAGDKMIYFTGDVIAAPDTERGCRTKIGVRPDGDVKTLWHNWSSGLHRVTCYGDHAEDLRRFCRFKKIEMFNEAARPMV